jgi:RNA polymerase sigma-70 factor (ECF subfamily)
MTIYNYTIMALLINVDPIELEKFRDGDLAVFKKVYDCLNEPLFVFLLRIVKDRHAAKDILIEIFARLWLKKARMESSSNIQNFIFKAGRNKAIDHLRSCQTRQSILLGDASHEIADAQPDPHHAMIRAETTNQLTYWYALALDKIMSDNHEYTKVFKLRYLDNKSIAEISGLLDKSPSTVRTQLGTAKTAFAEWLLQQGFESLPVILILSSAIF